MLLNPYEFNIKLLSIKNKINYKKKKIYPLKYDNKPLIVQSPIVYLPWGINEYNSLDISLDIENKNNKKDKLFNFYKFIKNIENYFKSLIFFKKKKFHSSIKPNNYYPDLLRISFNKNDTIIFDENKNKLNYNKILPKSFVKLIIQIAYIWINNDKYGIKWNVSQIKLYINIIFKPIEYSFIESDDETENSANNELYNKYFKMIKMGIPKIAVINKMKLNGVDPSILENKSLNSHSESNKNNFILELKKNKLKKSKILLKKNSKQYSRTNNFIIKPEDLLNAINKIKKKSIYL